jgi:UDP-N-acetylmuramoylalanine--D-glutamate ligase
MLRVEDISNWQTLPPDLSGLKVTVIGMARSGIAAAKLLQGAGCRVFVSDCGESPALRKSEADLKSLNIEAEIGGHTDRVFDADFIVRSPGVSLAVPVFKEALLLDFLIVSEIEVAFWFCTATVVAVTGSNGKTTTVEWLGDLFRRDGANVAVCGNVGRPFSSFVSDLKSGDIAVVEISSFQLENIYRFKPRVAVITNFSPDHLDRYDSYEDYLKTKCKIFEAQTADDALVYNRDDQKLTRYVTSAVSHKLTFGLGQPHGDGAGTSGGDVVLCDSGRFESVMQAGDINLPGTHNQQNSLAVACVAAELKASKEALVESLKNFPGVPHRLEVVAEHAGIRWINDSKATNIASGVVALDSFEEPIVLLAGGRDKGSDFGSIADQVAGKVKQVVLFGEAGPAMEGAWSGCLPTLRFDSMSEAVHRAGDDAQEGDVVLLSPMCASFDEFNNYEERGDMFKKMVLEICRRNQESLKS